MGKRVGECLLARAILQIDPFRLSGVEDVVMVVYVVRDLVNTRPRASKDYRPDCDGRIVSCLLGGTLIVTSQYSKVSSLMD